MNSIEERINSDLQRAMKQKDTNRVSVLRMITAAGKNLRIDKKGELVDTDFLQLLQKEIKQKKESLEQFQKAGRDELVKKEQEEISYLEEYLPTQLTEEEVRKLIDEVCSSVNAESQQDIGKVMGALMPKIQGQFDGRKAQELVREKLT